MHAAADLRTGRRGLVPGFDVEDGVRTGVGLDALLARPRRLAATAARGRSLAFFPEGTFTRVPALLPFHLGAFVAAVRAGVPIVPVAIRGTRALFRAGLWFPRRGALVVTIGAPIPPPSDAPDAFAAAVRLRDLARAEILRHCGEPDAGPGARAA